MNEATDAASSLDNDKTTNISHLFLRRQIVNSEENVSTRKARFLNWMTSVSWVAWLLPVEPDGVPPPPENLHLGTKRRQEPHREKKYWWWWVFHLGPFLFAVRQRREKTDMWTPPIQNGRFEQTNSLACYSTYIFKTVLRSTNNHKRGERRHTHVCQRHRS